MEPKPSAVNLFSVRRELIVDFRGTLSRIAEMGYLGVEPMIFGPIPLDVLPEDMRFEIPEPAAFRALLDEFGLKVASLHAPLPEEALADYVFGYTRALGCEQLVLASFAAMPGVGNAHADEGMMREAIERFGAAAARSEQEGVALGFHNHHLEWLDPFSDGRFAWDHFWGAVDPRVRAEVDLYWAQTAGQDPARIVADLGERVRRIHLKDGPCVLGEPQVALGEGSVDLERCVREAVHADWHIVELDDCATDMFEALEKSLDYIVDRGWSLRR